jgi:CDP-6-deoxy-D-xylo-4-hexulose-3-dehydrase
LNINPSKIVKAITPKTKAILAVNLLGNSCDYFALLDLAKEFNLILLEDNCESLGATWENQMLGTIGTMGTFSFFFSHHMQTMEGGMIVTNDDQTAQYLRSLRAHGWIRDLPNENYLWNKTGDPFEDSFKFVLPGYCVRPLEMSGAVGSVQLDKMPSMIAKRRANAKIFQEAFADFNDIITQMEIGRSSWFGFSIVLRGKLLNRRKELLTVLTQAGVETRPIVAGNFTKNPVIKYIPHEVRGSLDNADYIDQHGFFIGNDSRDLSEEILGVARIIKGLI